ncbi:VanW family protein [Patescibacteria group bacterium]|nr:VanW family protein [Patescibacteria group bacterium]
MKLKFIFFGALVGLVGVTIFSFTFLRFTPTTSPNTFLAGKNYSSLNRRQIAARLESDFFLPQQFTLVTDHYQTTLPTNSFSAAINSSNTVNRLLPPLVEFDLATWITQHFRRSPLPLHYQLALDYDSDQFTAKVASIASQIEKPFVPTELQLKNGALSVKPGALGVKVDTTNLETTILEHLKNWQFTEPISIPASSVGQLPTDTATQATLAQAQKLVGKNLTFTYETQTLTVDDATLISWLNFDGTLKTDKVTDYAHTINNTVKHDPVNATFKFDSGKVLDFQPASPGISIDVAQFVPLAENNLIQLESSANKSLTLALPLITVQPQVRNEDVNNLGIKELLGRGTSTFHHSTAIRNMNIERGAAVVNRILVAPGEEFSFIKNLGDVSLSNGYQKAYIIREGRTVLDVGGGICQVSTTLFRAMLNAGMEITARQYHAYRVSYYEEDSKPGFDATVFIPSPDLKFINDTGHYVLIQNTYDGVNKRLTYEIYGTSDGRTVDISNYHQWGASPAPPDVWVDDPTLPPGKVVQDEHAIPGLKTAFDWKVIRQGTVIHQKTFESDYTPWAAVYRRGVNR